MITGVREGDKESPKVLAQEIYPIEDAPRRLSKGIRIKLSARGADPGYVKDLKQVLARHRGRLPVRLHVVIPNRSETIINLSSVTCDPTEAFLAEVRNALGYEAVSFE
jgi:DNA polymerase III subunit alpha